MVPGRGATGVPSGPVRPGVRPVRPFLMPVWHLDMTRPGKPEILPEPAGNAPTRGTAEAVTAFTISGAFTAW